MDKTNPLPVFFVECDAVLGSLHLRVREHISSDWTVLFGPSGSGKSTLLRLLAGLWTPANSIVSVDGKDITATPAHKRGIVLVAQRPALFPNRTVRGNVAFGCESGKDGDAWVKELLHTFELSSLSGKNPSLLSGGEQQRAALARALAVRPRLLLLDEAFTGMHGTQQARLADTVRAYCAKLKAPVLSVTHDVAEAFRGDLVIRIKDGAIVARGRAEEVLAEEREMLLKRLNRGADHRDPS